MHKQQNGQAMVEFAIFLTVIMALCIGMLVSARLLNFQFWAQQDARYLAYEQTWMAQEYYNNTGEEPIDLHQNGIAYGGPKQLTRINSIKRESVGERASSILAWLFQEKLDALEQGKEQLSLLNTAYAKEFSNKKTGKIITSQLRDIKQTKLEKTFVEFLEQTDFAKRVCKNLKDFSAKNKIDLMSAFSNCEQNLNPEFAKQLAKKLDFKSLFEQYKLRLETGEKPLSAIKDSIRLELTEQYYSLFDNKVKQARLGATEEIFNGFQKAEDSFTDSSVSKMIDQARYVSSADAVQGIIDVSVDAFDPQEADAANLERSHAIFFGLFLFDNFKTQYEEDAYDFNFSYLPVPRNFGEEGIRMQEVVMSNILGGFTEEGLSINDDDLRDSMINHSGKYIEVNYRAKHGLFPAAAKWLSSSREVELTAKHYLITQPWQITRRNGLGDYRNKGTQDDSVDASSEEGILRRRTFGLWLYPSEFNSFASPIFNLAGLDEINSVLEVFEPLDFLLNEIKKGLVKNPFRTLVDALNSVPVIDKMVPELPQFPAVRPDAYPKSKELSGNEPGTPDRMIQNKERDFEDYVKEQKDLNPKPEPEYN